MGYTALMQNIRNKPFSTVVPLYHSTRGEGGNRSSSIRGSQPPSVGPEPGTVEVPVGSLVRYIGTHQRITFDDYQSDSAMVLARELVHREVVGGDQPNPDVWPAYVSILLIQWLDESGAQVDERWKPRAWVEQDGRLEVVPGWKAGRGPAWFMERHGPGTGKILWEVLE